MLGGDRILQAEFSFYLHYQYFPYTDYTIICVNMDGVKEAIEAVISQDLP